MPFGLFSGFTNSQAYAITDPSSIFASNLVAWYRGDSLVNSSGVVGTWTDKTINGNNLTATGSARPTYVSSSSNFNGYPTASFNGTSNVLTNSSLNGGGAGDITYMFLVIRLVTSANPCYVCNLGPGGNQLTILGINTNTTPSNFFVIYNSSGHPITATMSWANLACSVSVLSVGGSGTVNLYLNEDNLDNLNGSISTSSNPTWGSATLVVGASNASNSYVDGEIAEVVICNVQPTTKQTNQLYKYAQNRYNVDPPITTSAITNVSTAGGTARISGSGFNSTSAASNSVLGSLTTKYVNAGVIEITVPATTAGLYDITIANSNTGLTYTRNSFINVVSSASYDPMAILGTSCIMWAQANQVTSSAGSVSAMADQSLLGNILTQPTGADQPTLNTSDSSFNNQPSLSFNGSSEYMTVPVLIWDVSAVTDWFCLAVCVNTASVSEAVVVSYNQTQALLYFGSGVPTVTGRGGGSATWSSSELNLPKNISAWDVVGTSFAITVDNATPVTGTSVLAPQIGANLAIGAQTNALNYFTGKIACVIFCNAALTSTQMSNLQIWANNLFGT
jgi:hypothetical protein